MTVTLDATYSLGSNPSGVGVYSRQLLQALAAERPEASYIWRYRPGRFLRSFGERLPPSAKRGVLLERFGSRAGLFHGLNQRVPQRRWLRQVATFHDLFVMTAQYSTPEFRARFTAQAKQAAAEADLIIAVSKFTAGQVESLLGVEPSRIRVVYHGIQPLPVTARRPEKVVLHVGAIQERKNIARLVDAFEALPAGWRLVLAGSAGFGAEAILKKIQRSPRTADIEVTGYISNAVLAEWYAKAAIFAFPSLDEGFGMPVLEAMRAGVPVVASNGSAVAEVCGGAARQIDPFDVDSLSEALQNLAGDEGVRQTLVERGRKHAGKFSWARAAKETWQVYEELL